MRANTNITIEGATIRFRNFSGEEGKFNPAGKRNFCLFLDRDISEVLIRDGWNVRFLKSPDGNEDDQAYLQVAVAFGNINPKIVMMSSKGNNLIEEDKVGILDWAEIKNVDLIIRPYNYEVNGKSGVKAYLKTMYVTIAEDELEMKYRDAAITTAQDVE